MFSRNRRPAWRQEGFSLIEILLVLAIIALLSIAAFVIFVQVREANDANTETQNITTIIVGVRNLFGARADYAGLTTDLANQAFVFPKSMNNNVHTPGQPIVHLGRGLVDVEPAGVNNRSFAVIYRDTPVWLCIKIAQNYGKNVDEVHVDGVVVKAFGDIGSNPGLTIAECNRDELSDVSFIQR